MVSLHTLNYLASQKQKDAKALLREGRYAGAIYLMGYAVEFKFKRKIAYILGFTSGFPEYSRDYNLYTSQIATFNSNNTGIQLTQLRQIKNHDLSTLILFSGAELRITSFYFNEWLIVKDWNPEDRYKIRRYGEAKAKDFINAAQVILNQIA